MTRLARLFLTAIFCLTLWSCSTPEVHKWETPHSTYELGAFLDSGQATELKRKVAEKGFDSRVETGVIDGRLNYIVVVDLYGSKEEVQTSLQKIGIPEAKFRK